MTSITNNNIIKTYTFRSNRKNDNETYSSFANKTLLLSKMAKTESHIVDTQIHNFDKLKTSLRKGNAIDPKTRIYLTNKSKDIYELKMKENKKEEMFDIDVSFEEIFIEHQAKYNYYHKRYIQNDSNCNESKSFQKKSIPVVKVNDFYKKLKDVPNKTFNGISKMKLMKRMDWNSGMNTISHTTRGNRDEKLPKIEQRRRDNEKNGKSVKLRKYKSVTMVDEMDFQIEKELKMIQKRFPDFCYESGKRLKKVKLSDLLG